MKTFNYKAYDTRGRLVAGQIVANSHLDLLSKLGELGLHPFSTHQADQDSNRWSVGRNLFGSLSLVKRSGLTTQLGVLLDAGITLDRSLQIIASQSQDKSVRIWSTKVLEGVSQGIPLSETMEGFGSEETSLIRAGEKSGELGRTLLDLAEMLENKLALRNRLLSALIYPIILLTMAAGAGFVIVTVLIPNIAPLFQDSGVEPPFIVRVGVILGANFQGYLTLGILVLACLGLAWLILKRSSTFKNRLSMIVFRVPVLGSVLREAEATSICRTLGILLRSGLSLQQSLQETVRACRSSLIKAQLETVVESVSSGMSLSTALSRTSVFNNTSLQMIAVGEETNRLDSMLLRTAKNLQTNLAQRIERLMTILTPVMTVAIGFLVGGLIVSVMRAVLAINNLAVQ